MQEFPKEDESYPKELKEERMSMEDTTKKTGQNMTPDSAEQRKQENAKTKEMGGGNNGRVAERTKRREKVPRRTDRKTTEGARIKSAGREKDTRITGKRPPETGRKGKKRQRTGRGAKAKREGKKRYRGTKRKGLGGRTTKTKTVLIRYKPPGKRRLGTMARTRRSTAKGMRQTGHTFHPENDWGIADRQAEDRASADENASNRQRREWEEQGRFPQGAYPEPSIVINTTRRWSGDQCG